MSEVRTPSAGTVQWVLDQIALGNVNPPEGYEGLSEIKKRPVGEWTFDEVSEAQVAKLADLNYNGEMPVNKGHASALIGALEPRKTGGRGRPRGSKNRPKSFADMSEETRSKPVTAKQFERIAKERAELAAKGIFPEVVNPTNLGEASDEIQRLMALNTESETSLNVAVVDENETCPVF